MLVTFGSVGNLQDKDVNAIVVIAGALFIFPYFLLSATAGRIADKFEMSKTVVIIKLAEIGIMLVATFGFYTANLEILLSALALMGVHSTFFGPLKYGLLPCHLAKNELLSGNALIETGTFLAILIGTISGGVLVSLNHGWQLVCGALTLVSTLGLSASLFIPRTEPAAPELKISYNLPADTWAILADAFSNRIVGRAIVGASWFWLAGATVLSQLPALTKDVLHAGNQVVTLFLTVFSFGIGVGSIACNRLNKGKLSTRYSTISAVCISIFAADLYFAFRGYSPVLSEINSLGDFLSTFMGWRVLMDLFLLAASSGLYVVPLYTILQEYSEAGFVARNIAANNILNAAFITLGALATVVLLALGYTPTDAFLVLAIANLAISRTMPRV